ncbi:MAG: transposase [Flavisolibacter sp.]|nr:transposase [Flavisolibacter sp.]
MSLSAVLLFEDEIQLHLFPVLARAWALKGEQARVGITARNAKGVLFGTINLRTGHRIVMRQRRLNQDGFQAFLRVLRRRYPGRQIWLVLDEATAHTAPQSQFLADTLDIQLVWLPRQCPELNAMDHLWKELRANIAANYQYETIEQHAAVAEHYTLKLTNRQALKKAGILSKNFWLKSFLK